MHTRSLTQFDGYGDLCTPLLATKMWLSDQRFGGHFVKVVGETVFETRWSESGGIIPGTERAGIASKSENLHPGSERVKRLPVAESDRVDGKGG